MSLDKFSSRVTWSGRDNDRSVCLYRFRTALEREAFFRGVGEGVGMTSYFAETEGELDSGLYI